MPGTDKTPIAGNTAVLARRYAGALFELAEDQNQLDAVASDLRAVKELTHEGREFHILAIDFNIRRDELVKAMQAFAKAARLHTFAGNFLALVAQNRRLGQLGAMCDAFFARLAEKRGEFSAKVRAARPLSRDQQLLLATQLQTLAGGKVHVSVKEDKGLIGGLVVKIGSKLIDASVKSKLARMERQLKLQSLNAVKGTA